MAHSNGRIYIDTSATPNVGISIADIQQTLGSGRNDIGGLIVNGNINPWSKYKPVRMPELDYFESQYDKTNGEWKSNADWWKARYTGSGVAYCGFNIQTLSSLSDISNYYDGDMNGWTYQRPTGRVSGSGRSPYRFMDFCGYLHRAIPPVDSFLCAGGVVTQDYSGPGDLTFSLSSDTPRPGTDVYDGSLHWSDFADFSTYYFGVALLGNTVIRATSATSLYNGGTTVTLSNLRSMTAGEYDVYPFISTAILTQGGSESGTYRPVPKVSKCTIKVVPSYIVIAISATERVNGRLLYTITVYNYAPSERTFSTNYVMLRKPEYYNNPDATWESVESATVRYFNNITIPGNGGSYTEDGVYNNYDSSLGFIYVNVNGLYTQKANWDKPIDPLDPLTQ